MTRARKKPVNVNLDEKLVAEARKLNINLSKTLEKAVVSELRQARREKWLKDNQGAVRAHNRRVEEHGAFSEGVRSF
ncbi:MAG: type II toxin-antitoxin system CcdA family antitoxin [Mariprofundaceae bacterium]|nr:type II toxin-antitoxin system CcdA family antitoxin [Mariprofundaceae bacterium]